MKRPLLILIAAAAVTALACESVAQTQSPIVPSAQPDASESEQAQPAAQASGTLAALMTRIGEAEDFRRAGLRASLLRQAQRTLGFVVIVDDAPSYLYAISQWEGLLRFPVLWDDGRAETRENIARFVRAYRPEQVLRLHDDGDWGWGEDRPTRERWIEQSLSKAISEQSDDWAESLRSIRAQGIIIPGVVLTDSSDDAWAGALALAAGRLQAIGFAPNPSRISRALEPDSANALERAAERLAASTGRPWEGMGDEIDAITLAMNTGTLIKTGAGNRDRIATSDRIGRREHNGAGQRWAYCGQLIGSEAQSVYRAMCGLFLEIDQAYIWDGYGSGVPWSDYDGTVTEQALSDGGIETELHDQPRNTARDWYMRHVRPIGATAEDEPDMQDDLQEDGSVERFSSLLFLMNSKGAPSRFDLEGGTQEECGAGDVPTMRTPTAMHMVHSFSLARPWDRSTVGGRLLERGVYVYAGSVDEPYLGGFVRTPDIARRLMAGIAFGTAVRQIKGQVWKIAVLGDPLVAMGGAGTRTQADLLLEDMIDLDERVKTQLKAGEYEGAMRDLVMLGRDDDAARLTLALLGDKPGSFSPGTAMIAMPVLQREGEFVAMVDCYERMDTAGRADGRMQDLLWLTSPYLLARGGRDASLLARVEALLRGNLRSGQKIRDAERLAMHLRSRSPDAALGVLESLRQGMNENQTRMLERVIDRVMR